MSYADRFADLRSELCCVFLGRHKRNAGFALIAVVEQYMYSPAPDEAIVHQLLSELPDKGSIIRLAGRITG